MNPAALFIRRPVATTLLTLGITIAGLFAFAKLNVAPLPQVDFPTLQVQANMAGASPETMAMSVAAPLERHLGQIADVSEMTSQNSTGSTQITLQFNLNRNIDGAARDVQAAINAAHADLPTALKSNPTYRKFNPAEAPILIVALSSKTLSLGQLYDSAATVLQQKLSQLEGIGNVNVGGSSLPAVRVELEPDALIHYGIGLEDIRAALSGANANSPKGIVEEAGRRFQIYANDQGRKASDYRDLVIAYRNNAPVFLKNVGDVIDSVEDLRNQGIANSAAAVTLIITKQPGANIVDTVDRLKAILPQIKASLPGDVEMTVTGDRSKTIRASLLDTEMTLILSVVLVIGVVFVFLRDWRATLIPGLAVPVSIIGTFAAMYLCQYTLDNLSLMALTIATGFVVDDAIVVLENIARHLEAGMPRLEAAMKGAKEVGFTVIAMSLSLIAVFLPILLMGGLVGRLFQEFAVVLSLAILISLVLSLTATPVMCAYLLKPNHSSTARRKSLSEKLFDWIVLHYGNSLRSAINHKALILLLLILTIVANVALYAIVPKGLFPQQDAGLLMGGIQADQSISFQAMREKLFAAADIVRKDPAVADVVGFTGGRGTNSANVFVSLKPRSERDPIFAVMNRLRPQFDTIPGAQSMLFPMQDLFVGGRQSFAQYQYTLQADDTALLHDWGKKLLDAMRKDPMFTDVSSDQQEGGLESYLQIDRQTAARYGLNVNAIDTTLYDAFGQRQVSTIFNALNQYHVVMEIAPRFLEDPESLKRIYVSTSGLSASGTQTTNAVSGTVAQSDTSTSLTTSSSSDSDDSARNAATNSIGASSSSASSGAAVSTSQETMVPLSSVVKVKTQSTPIQVNHQGQFAATTLSFNLKTGKTLSDASAAINEIINNLHMPSTIVGAFAGSAATFQSSSRSQPLLILSALATIYVVLGLLYESYSHPLTILSTLPSAGVGAVLAILLSGGEFNVIALIGVFLLIGIVKKNAILMIDFALDTQRSEGLPAEEAIYKACLLRLRPILMTTFAALLGAVPLVIGFGEGAELRRPLGIAIIGGLTVSQLLTLYTTPIVFIYLDRLSNRFRREGTTQFPADLGASS